jgi:hypothetical protein
MGENRDEHRGKRKDKREKSVPRLRELQKLIGL